VSAPPEQPDAGAQPEAPVQLERVARAPQKFSGGPPREPSAIGQAIAEIGEVVESLKRALDQMEEILELAELAERQKTADEQEIESLRRALRQLQQRPRGSRPPEDRPPPRSDESSFEEE